MTPSPKPGSSTYETHFNVDRDAHVGMQAGVMHGDVHFYQAIRDTPQEKYRVGLNYLNANAHRTAERLIGEAFMRGHRSIEVAYYWVLAILGGRSFDHLDKDDFSGLTTAFEFIGRRGEHQWRHALVVVHRLVYCLVQQDSRGDPDPVEFERVMRAFEQLPSTRREEIRRHLEMILAGGIQDRLELRYASEVSYQRMSHDRVKRAWKFFQQEPLAPRWRVPRPIAVTEATWAKLATGIFLCGGALLLLAPVLGRAGVLSWVTTLLLCGAGGGCAVTYRWEQLWHTRRRRANAARRAAIPADDGLPASDTRGREHADLVRKLVNFAFNQFRPEDEARRRHWNRSVAGVKNSLRREIIEVYGADVGLRQIVWLIFWHARRAAQDWKSGTLPAHDPLLRTPRWTVPLIVTGVVLFVTGAYIGLAAAFGEDWPTTILVVPPLAGGAALTYSAATTVWLERRRHADELVEAQQEYEAHYAGYQDWCRRLVDRPDDSEMARWLDYDKAHIKSLAMRQYELTNRDIIAHAVLTEAKPPCARARVLYGPPRYSDYVVRVFLLTEGGLRHFAVELDFLKGVIGDEERTAFHYGAIVAAQVKETSVRLNGNHRSTQDAQPGRPPKPGDEGLGKPGQPLVFNRTFRLSLLGNEVINVRVENFDQGLIDRMKEDPRTLVELALDVAGVSGALRILESVAAEGKDWIAREHRRRGRRLHTYEQAVDPQIALDGGQASKPQPYRCEGDPRGSSCPERPACDENGGCARAA